MSLHLCLTVQQQGKKLFSQKHQLEGIDIQTEQSVHIV
jgi:hypothetical protein